ncbi:MAG TPA: hypothetical protein VEC57_07620 [Candidatus Limnocylindrales bacterium]|nr:hypothetical protein [Candidatus Limnocylindrales bacterium]
MRLAELRSFLLRVAVMMALVVAGYLAILVAPTAKNSYLSAVIDKQARLASLGSPKLVFVGGSNLSFALDSARIERELGMPVVNMGLGIYAGLRFMLYSVLPRLGEGDVVVVSPEYQLFRGLYNGEEELLEALEAFPQGISTIGSVGQWLGVVRALPTYIKNKANRMLAQLVQDPDPKCVYCRRAFNPYGDLMAHAGLPATDVAAMPMFRSKSEQGPVDMEAVAGLREFVQKASQRGARVVILFPAVPDAHLEKNLDVMEKVHQAIRDNVAAPVLATPSESTMPVDLFWDWVYHLKIEGRERRTGFIIERLRPVIAGAAPR